jgi:hypothetical protein
MPLYDPERPQVAPHHGIPAILVDGSAVPQISVMPQEDGKMLLSCMLWNYDYNTRESYNYSYHTVEVTPDMLPGFFNAYGDNPEQTLLDYFGWKPQGHKPMRTQRNTAPKRHAKASDYVNSLI